MKKRTMVLIITLCILLLIGLAGKILLTVTTENLEKLRDIPLQTLELSATEDGVYTGSFAQFPLDVEVKVVVTGQRIVSIELLKHRNGQGEAAETIPSVVVREQSLQVDSVSGATYSSIVILKAIENALSGK